jgi:hypothetical protein
MNRSGAPASDVRAAVRALEREPDPARFAARFRDATSRPTRLTSLGLGVPGVATYGLGDRADAAEPLDVGDAVAPPYRAEEPAARVTMLAEVDRVHRLALEMCLHEEAERRALEGDLRALDAAWREAEEIAAIADDLALPPSIGERLARLRRG